jgi:hypothetical protein
VGVRLTGLLDCRGLYIGRPRLRMHKEEEYGQIIGRILGRIEASKHATTLLCSSADLAVRPIMRIIRIAGTAR